MLAVTRRDDKPETVLLAAYAACAESPGATLVFQAGADWARSPSNGSGHRLQALTGLTHILLGASRNGARRVVWQCEGLAIECCLYC